MKKPHPRGRIRTGAAVKIPKGRYVVKRHGKYRDFPRQKGRYLFLFALRGFFAVAGRVNRAPLRFGLCLCRVDLSGLAPSVAAGNTFNGHNCCFYGFSAQKYGIKSGNFARWAKKMRFFAKIKEKLLEIQKIVVPLQWVKETTQPPGRVSGTKITTVMNAKVIARDILNTYMEKEGEFIREQFEGLNDEQAKVMAMAIAAVMVKNNISRI